MRALLVDHSAPSRIVVGDTADPVPAAAEAVVRVMASSLNRGESMRLGDKPAGFVPGWDLAGEVEVAAADGSGPPVGEPVFGLVRAGAWAEHVAVPTSQLHSLPSTIEAGVAASLPMAGLTALRTLRLGGDLRGARVLLTGASGGFGRLAIQLAAGAGALVAALTSRPEREAGLRALGADFAGGEHELDGRFDMVLETVGGDSLTRALVRHVAADGLVVAMGNASRRPTSFAADDMYRAAPGARMVAFAIWHDIETHGGTRHDLGDLLARVKEGTLEPDVSRRAGWNQAADAIGRLLRREIGGKVVLDLA